MGRSDKQISRLQLFSRPLASLYFWTIHQSILSKSKRQIFYVPFNLRLWQELWRWSLSSAGKMWWSAKKTKSARSRLFKGANKDHFGLRRRPNIAGAAQHNLGMRIFGSITYLPWHCSGRRTMHAEVVHRNTNRFKEFSVSWLPWKGNKAKEKKILFH